MKALQTLNVYSSDYGMCLAQKCIEEKTNEIPAAQELLKLMDLSGTIVTADVLNCQKLKAFGTVHKTLTKGEKTEEEYRYYICSIG